jgi:hypothetical protein
VVGTGRQFSIELYCLVDISILSHPFVMPIPGGGVFHDGHFGVGGHLDVYRFRFPPDQARESSVEHRPGFDFHDFFEVWAIGVVVHLASQAPIGVRGGIPIGVPPHPPVNKSTNHGVPWRNGYRESMRVWVFAGTNHRG